jgi:hypothetical protein
MDEAFKRYWGCGRKRYFRSQTKADNAIRNMATYSYHCQYCDGWHLVTKVAAHEAARMPWQSGRKNALKA